MLAMKTCRRWILLVVTGSVIGGILAGPNTADSAITAPTSGWINPPGDGEVPGVEPLPTAVPSSEITSKDEISTTTIGGDDVPKHPFVPLAGDKRLSTNGRSEYDAKHGKDLPPSASRIEAIPPTNSTRGSYDSKPDTPAGLNLDTGTVESRAFRGNDVGVISTAGKTNTRNSLHGNITDLSDVSMDYDDKDIEGGEYLAGRNVSGPGLGSPAASVIPAVAAGAAGAATRCTYGNETYPPGTEIRRDCEDRCVCGEDGKLGNCRALCVAPFIRAGRGIQDSLCHERLIPDEPCCATMVCAEDSEPEPEESCYLGNKTVARGDTVEDGCSTVCLCEARGTLKCRPRCPPSNSTTTSVAGSNANRRDKCVPVPDPRDACCTITLCDVTLGDLDQFKPTDFLPAEAHAAVNLTKVEAINATAIKLIFSGNRLAADNATVQLSVDNLLWKEQKLGRDGIVGDLEPSRVYYVRLWDYVGGRPGAPVRVHLPAKSTTGTFSNGGDAGTSQVPGAGNRNETAIAAGGRCDHRGKSYKVGEEWYDECISFCTCSMAGKTPKTECATIECPTDFGLDVLDPNCLDWEWVPEDFVPIPPRCCSQEVRCRNNGSCLYEGKSYNNWSEIPTNVTGCEKRCYCELGNVSCQPACPPVPALPPANLQCPPSHASLVKIPEDECCLHWVCGDSSAASLPPKIGRNPLPTDSINQLQLQTIDDKKIPGISGSGNLQQWAVMQGSLTDRYATVPPRKYHEPSSHPDATDDHGRIHYPMDPGHPTTTTTTTTTTIGAPPPLPPPPYHGPYDPGFVPTQPSVEDVFRLTPRTDVDAINLPQIPKDGPKSKTESKKPVEPAKPVKDARAEGEQAPYFAPPVVNVAERQGNSSRPILATSNRIPLPFDTLGSAGVPVAPSPQQKNYSSFTLQPSKSPYKVDPPHGGGESVAVPHFQFHRESDNDYSAPEVVRYGNAPPYSAGPEGPNTIFRRPVDRQNNNLAARDEATVKLNGGYQPKPLQRPPPPPVQMYLENSRPGPGGKTNANEHDLPEELYRLINLHHPGLIRLDQDPPEGYQGLYGAASTGPKEHEGIGPIDGTHRHPGSLHYFNPQVFADAEENYGEAGGYHVHRGSETPGGTRQQIEELLLRVGEKDPNLGPFQRYPPGQEPNVRKPPRVTVPKLPQNSGRLTPFNHPFAAAGTATVHDVHSLTVPDHGLLPGFPVHGHDIGQGAQSSSDQVTVQTLEAVAENRVRLVFTVPHVFVGLHGRVEVRYTSDTTNFEPTTWKSQVFAPPEDLIATPQLEFELGDLKASTEYKVMVTVKLRDLSNSPTSKIYKVVTLEAPAMDVATLPPQIPTDAELTVAEANSTWANIVWKMFTEYELQFIDGVQLRYKETEGKVYAATPLIHRAVTSYVIENLKPAVTYEVGIYFIPFPGQTTELVSEKPINFTTSAEPDPYSFDIKVEIKGIKSTEVEVAWRGVPYPEDKYVNIYRAIYQSDTGKEDTSTFKIAKRDSPARTMIGELKPGTRYRLWIEVYLTNGRIKKSNVQDFVTKPGIPTSAGVFQQGKLATQVPLHEGDYYGPLVIVAIVASLAILSTLILLMMLMKRRTSSKADISPRKTTAAYDNPSYKTCEDVAPATSCNGQKMESA